MPAVNRRLPELIFQRFAQAPGYLIYDEDTGQPEYIDNHTRNLPGMNGTAAAAVLAARGVDAVVAGRMDDRGVDLLRAAGIEAFCGFVGTCELAVAAYRAGDLPAAAFGSGSAAAADLAAFDFIDVGHTFNGENVVYADWDFIRPMAVPDGLPRDWTSPIDFGNGYYFLEVEVATPESIAQPVELEFGFFNVPPDADPERLERCSFGQYCRIPGSGKWMHIAALRDMELTTLSGNEKEWDWSRAWFEPFVLIKPFEQEPYPFAIDLKVTVIEAETG
jgi:predicted Fe-Mo cluster-binding NifX family protein